MKNKQEIIIGLLLPIIILCLIGGGWNFISKIFSHESENQYYYYYRCDHSTGNVITTTNPNRERFDEFLKICKEKGTNHIYKNYGIDYLIDKDFGEPSRVELKLSAPVTE